MRTFAIGDIHGCFRALEALVAGVPVAPDDRVITLGDVVDRGPDSRRVVEWLLARHGTGTLVPLLGNHEQMALEARLYPDRLETWAACGGSATLASYGAGRHDPAAIPEAHWEFFARACLPFHEEERHFFVHANARPDVPLSEQSETTLLWEKVIKPKPHASGKIMIYGHTPDLTGAPRVSEGAVCLDTWAYGGGWLTCLEPATGKYWQADEHGSFRWGVLGRPGGSRGP